MTPLDRAAMALCIARGKRWAEQSETEARLLRIEAEAVFVSLYEQSDEMVAAGGQVAEECDFLSADHMVSEVFTAMMKAARR